MDIHLYKREKKNRNFSNGNKIFHIYLPSYFGAKVWILCFLFSIVILYQILPASKREFKNNSFFANDQRKVVSSESIKNSNSDPILKKNLLDNREVLLAMMQDRYRLLDQLIIRKEFLLKRILGQITQIKDIDKNSVAQRLPSNNDEKSEPLNQKQLEFFNSFRVVQSFTFTYSRNLTFLPHIVPIPNTGNFQINSFFGFRQDPINRKYVKHHDGVDLKASAGQSVFAAAHGTVIQVRRSNYGYGNMIRLAHYLGYETIYAHLQEILVKKNQTIAAGDLIGKVGATGKVTGPHLHYEVRYKKKAVNPLQYGIQIYR